MSARSTFAGDTFFKKVAGLQALLKRDPSKGVFLWILPKKNISEWLLFDCLNGSLLHGTS